MRAADKRPAEEVVEIIRDRGGEAVANYDDVGDWSGAENLVNAAIDAFGALDIVVNNAGILRDASIVKMTEDEFDSVLRVHLKGTFNTTHFAGVYWQSESKAGRMRRAAIVNTVSSAGLQGNKGQANYGAAKAGIAALTTITALEMGRFGVRANAIAPGGATRMVAAAMPQIQVTEADEVERGRVRPAQPRQLRPDGRLARLRRGDARHRAGVPGRRRRDHALHPLDARHRDQDAEGPAQVGPGRDRRRRRTRRSSAAGPAACNSGG